MPATINILNPDGTLWRNVPLTSECKRTQELMKEDCAQLQWRDEQGGAIPAGAYIEWEGETLILLDPYSPERPNETEYLYKPQFQSEVMAWGRKPLFFYDRSGSGNPTREPDWNVTMAPTDILRLICQAIEEETGVEWTVGGVSVENPGVKVLAFQSTDILSGLNQLANEYETEWRADKQAKKIWLCKADFGDAFELRTATNCGTPSASKGGESYYNRFYVFGGTRNITQEYRGANVNNLINRRLTLDPALYPDSALEPFGAVQGQAQSKILVFDDVYPKAWLKLDYRALACRMMYVIDEKTNQRKVVGTDGEGNPIYDQYAIWYFKPMMCDADWNKTGEYMPIDHPYNRTEADPDGQFIPGLKLSVHFQTGQLAGRDFELQYHTQPIHETPATGGEGLDLPGGGWFEILYQSDGGYILPTDPFSGVCPFGGDETHPNQGDEVIIFNVVMPDQYFQPAYQELKVKADKHIQERYAQDMDRYQCKLYPQENDAQGCGLVPGSKVHFYHPSLLETRVIRIETLMCDPSQQTVTVGNSLTKGSIQRLQEEVTQASKSVDALSLLNAATETNTQAWNRAMTAMQEGFAKIADMWHFDPSDPTNQTIYSPYNVWVEGYLSAKGKGDDPTELDLRELVQEILLEYLQEHPLDGGGGGLDLDELELWIAAKGYLTDYDVKSISVNGGAQQPLKGSGNVDVNAATSIDGSGHITAGALQADGRIGVGVESGYGIPSNSKQQGWDAAKALLEDLFEKVNIGTEEAPKWSIKAKYGLWTEQFLSAKGVGDGSAEGGIGYEAVQEMIADALAGYNPSTGSIDWDSITGKPDTFAPSAHSHGIADVTGLQDALAGKVPTTRTISAGTGLTGGGTLAADRTISLNATTVGLLQMLSDMFEWQTVGGVRTIKAKASLWTEGYLSAKGVEGEQSGGSALDDVWGEIDALGRWRDTATRSIYELGGKYEAATGEMEVFKRRDFAILDHGVLKIVHTDAHGTQSMESVGAGNVGARPSSWLPSKADIEGLGISVPWGNVTGKTARKFTVGGVEYEPFGAADKSFSVDVDAATGTFTIGSKTFQPYSAKNKPTASDVGARPNTWTPTASDVGVPAWAQAATKPSYTAAEVGARPSTWTPTATDVGVPAWAQSDTKPTYTAAEVGARPSTWTPSASDVGADPAGTAATKASAAETAAKNYADGLMQIGNGSNGGKLATLKIQLNGTDVDTYSPLATSTKTINVAGVLTTGNYGSYVTKSYIELLNAGRFEFAYDNNTRIEDWVKATAATRKAGHFFSTDGWAWARSSNLKLTDSISVDSMRYSAISIRNGDLTGRWQQQAMLFVPTYSDESNIYLAQMTVSETAGVVETAVKRYADYDTIMANVGNAYLPLTGGTLTGSLLATGFGIKFDRDTSQALAFSWRNAANTATTAQVMYHNTAQNIIINPCSNEASDVWSDAVGKYSLFVGKGRLTYNGYNLLRSDNYSSYALPLSGGTITNTATNVPLYIKSNSNSLIGYHNNASGILGYLGIAYNKAPFFVEDNGNIGHYLLHAGNYSSYALPLTGGTLTGSLSVSGNVGIGTTEPRAMFHAHLSGSASGSAISIISNYSTNPYGLITRIYDTGCVSLQSQRITTTSEYFSLSLNPLGGNVGIGTTSPAYRLDVNGNIRANGVRMGRDWSIANRGSLRIDSAGAAYPTDLLFGSSAETTQTSWEGVQWAITSRNAENAGRFQIARGSGNSATAMETVALTINGSDLNVGIGTTSPAYKLHVVGSSGDLLRLDSSGTYSCVGFSCKANATDASADFRASAGANGTDYYILSNSRYQFQMNLTSGQIKTQAGIHIGRTGFANSFDEGIRIAGESNQWCAIAMGTSASAYSGATSTTWWLLKTNVDTFRLGRGTNSASGFLEILNSGNVGIGTASPDAKLHVAGAVHATVGVYTEGYVTAQQSASSSDIRLKDIIGDYGLSVEKIANAPSVRFAWKDSGREDIGSIAQYWQEVSPHSVLTDPHGNLSLQYGKLGLLASISVARREIELEAEVERLKQEVEQLKAQIA